MSSPALARQLFLFLTPGLLLGLLAKELAAATVITPLPEHRQTNPPPARSTPDGAPAAKETEPPLQLPAGTSLFTGRLVVPGRTQFEPRAPRNNLELQLALARRGFSPGSLDGLMGPQTRAALAAFQDAAGLPVTGRLDEGTRSRLQLREPPWARVVVRPEDVAGLRPPRETWRGRASMDRLGYTSLLEWAAEISQSHPDLVRRANRVPDWERLGVGSVVTVPNARLPSSSVRASHIRIRLGERLLQVFDDQTNLVAHFPCSIGHRVSQRPVGRLQVAVVVENPDYTFDPKVFPESPQAQQVGGKLILPPGPNNPVGVAWIGLNRPGYGIHGTPEPEKVGRTESHGCFRLANWNAVHLLRLVRLSMPVYVEP